MKPGWKWLYLFLLLAFAGGAMAQQVYMNEIYTRGVATDPDWIELYNGAAAAVDIGGYKIYDSGGKAGTKPKKEIPAGTVIPAKGFYVVVTDGSNPEDFGLSSGGEAVWLENTAGAVIDTVAFPALQTTETFGRFPDGGAWRVLKVITRGTPNVFVVMNEIYSRGTTADPDWIELYNASATPIDLGGYKIYDSGGKAGTKPKKEIAAGTMIPAKGFYVVVTDGSNPEDFGLSSSGEAVWLENATGAVIDTVAFPGMETTQTFGRYPDGGAWKLLNVITRGTPNVIVLMNEIYSRGTSADPDWIELYNSSAAPMDLSGFKIYDSGSKAGTKPKKQIAAGTVIPANGFYVVVTDGSNPEDFGLSSGGEAVWLEDAAGAVMDTVVFPAMETTQSFGRLPDGGEWGLLTTITRGATNGSGTGVTDNAPMVAGFRLAQNYPNPFNPSTTITFTLPRDGAVVLRVYDALGRQARELINGYRAAGTHQVIFTANGLATGAYFVRLEAAGHVMQKAMLLVK